MTDGVTTVQEMIAAANATVPAIEPAEAVRLQGAGAVLIDVREPAEREREGGAPGALAIPRGVLEFQIDPNSPNRPAPLQNDPELVFFCAGGARSALAAQTAQRLGYRVKHVAGGFAAWKRDGAPIA